MKKAKILIATLALALSASANAAFITISTSDGGIYDVDTGTGIATELIAAGGPAMTDLARDASGNLWGVTFGNLYSIDTSNSSATFTNKGSLGINTMNALTFDANDNLFGASYDNTNLYSINTTTGAAHDLGSGSEVSSGDLAFDAAGTLFLAADTSPNDTLVIVDPGNGGTTYLTGGGDMGHDYAYGLAFVDTVMYGVSSAGVLYTINTGTGEATSLGAITGITGAIYGATTSLVPVPATVWLFASGLLGLLGFSRRRT